MENDDGKKKREFEMTPEQATDIPAAAGWFDRKKVMVTICASIGAVVCVAMLINVNSASGGGAERDGSENPAVAPAGFVEGLRDRAVVRVATDAGLLDALQSGDAPEEPEPLPAVEFVREIIVQAPPPSRAPPPPPPVQAQTAHAPPPSRAQPATDPTLAARHSGLVPQRIDGSLFSGNQAASSGAAATFSATSLNHDTTSNGFYPPQTFPDMAAVGHASGGFIDDGTLWVGTIVPGILVTAVNTDLPGHILARVTRNVYDSQTGRTLLIPQGTVMVARYNSSVSFAQDRVQIAWDTLIRPDGFAVDLGGMGGVDAEGMSGQAARYHGNWFEYMKAAAVVTVFAMAGSSMAETAARYSDTAAATAAGSGSDLVARVGGDMIDRAMEIQPTLTVANGTHVNIMVNRTVRLPPVPDVPVTERFVGR